MRQDSVHFLTAKAAQYMATKSQAFSHIPLLKPGFKVSDIQPISEVHNNQASADMIATLAQIIPGFIYQLKQHANGHFSYTYVSNNYADFFAVDIATLQHDASPILNMIHPDDVNDVFSETARCAELGIPWHCEFRMILKCGKIVWIDAYDIPTKQPDGSILYTGYANDITERKEASEKLARLAHYDSLTLLANRALFMELVSNRLQRYQHTQQQLALLFLDLDLFKPVNDQYGHAAGDALLTEVAKRISGSVRKDDIVGRIGGDEFVVCVTEIPNNDDALATAQLVANNVQRAITQQYLIDEQPVVIGASIGIAIYPHHAIDVATLLQQADMAMYQAKKSGRKCIAHYTPS